MEETTGDRLLSVRTQRGDTQEAAAAAMRTKQANVQRWEKDLTDPKYENRAPLADYLGVTDEELSTLRSCSDRRRRRRAAQL